MPLDEPLLKFVSVRSYCEAIYDGLEEWLRQEALKPGKQHPTVALDGTSLAILQSIVERIREYAKALSVVRVRMTNREIQMVKKASASHVRYRLAVRIGDRLEVPRYVEVETNDGPLWVTPHYESGTGLFRISARVRHWDDRYDSLGTVRTTPEIDTIEIPFEPSLPPGFLDRLARHGQATYQVATEVPAFAERLRDVFKEWGIPLREALRRLVSGREASFKIEVVRAGRIEIVEVERRAVSGGDVVSVFEERLTDADTEIVDIQPTRRGVRAFLEDMQTYYEEGAREGAGNLMDILDGSRATDEELAEQQAIVDRATELSTQAMTAAGAYLRNRGIIGDAEEWRLARITEVVEKLGDRNGTRYMAQVRRRLGKMPDAPVSILQKHVEEIAQRELPADITSPEHAIILAAQGAAALYPRLPIFVPPLDLWFDHSMSLIVIADRVVEEQRSQETANEAKNSD